MQVIYLAIVAWLPGAVLFRAPIADRSKRAQLDPEERLFWSVIISIAFSVSVAFALAAVGRYTFPRVLIADVVAAAAIGIATRFDLRLGSPRRLPSWTAILPLTLVALGVWRFFPPAEFIIGGRDPGIYINEGVQIAQQGTFVYDDPLVASVPPFARDLFFRSYGRSDYYGLRWVGFQLLDIRDGSTIGQFPHLFPASVAIAYGIDGLTGARRVVGVWAILGLLSVYFLGTRLVGRLSAWAGASLLAIHLVQVWFGRYPNSEMAMQAVLWAALLAIGRGYVDGDRFFTPVGGVLLAILPFLRLDAIVGIAAACFGIALLGVSDRKWRWTFLIPLFVAAPLALGYYLGPMWPHFYRYYIFLLNLRPSQLLLMAFAAAAAAAILVLGARREAIRSGVYRWTPSAAAAAVVIAAMYALFFRKPGGRLAPHDAYALRTFTEYYLTLPGLVAALIGFVMAARRAFWRAPAFFAVVVVSSFFLFYKIYIVPEHFWMTRRFVPVVLPAALLFAAVAALGARGGASLFRPLRWTIGLVFLVLLGREYARRAEPVMDHVEYAGVIPRLERLAQSLGDNDLLIVESDDAETDVHTLAVPLADIYARNVLVLTSAAPDKAAFASFLEWAKDKYARVLFLGAGGTDLLSPSYGARVIATDRFRVPEFAGERDEYPRQPRSKQFDYTVYQFVAAPVIAPDGDVTIDVGTEDDLNVLRFHAKEETEGATFRWSQDVSYVIVPRVDAGDRTITLWMSNGGRPGAVPPADVTIALDDEPIGTVRVDDGFKPYALQIPPTVAAGAASKKTPIRLKLTTSVWSPEQLLGSPDDRELGVMVDRVTLK
jgi:hypothetical protein